MRLEGNSMTRPTGPITFYGHKGEWERFKILAEMKGKSASELLTEMIRRAVKRGAK